MSDYLTNLIARTLNIGSLVEPKLPSLFERSPLNAVPIQSEEMDVVEEQATPSRRDLTSVNRSAERPTELEEFRSEDSSEFELSVPQLETNQNQSHPESRPVTPRLATPETDSVAPDRMNQQDFQQFRSRPLEPRAPSSMLETEPAATPISEAAAANDKSVLSRSEKSETPDDQPSLLFKKADTKRSTANSTQQEILQPVARNSKHRSYESATHDMSARNPEPAPLRLRQIVEHERAMSANNDESVRPSGVAIVPAVAGAVQGESDEAAISEPRGSAPITPKSARWQKSPSSFRRRQRTMEIESEPAINVTIGRVEVYAVQASGPAKNLNRQTSPVMTLEEYLRRQQRGSDR